MNELTPSVSVYVHVKSVPAFCHVISTVDFAAYIPMTSSNRCHLVEACWGADSGKSQSVVIHVFTSFFCTSYVRFVLSNCVSFAEITGVYSLDVRGLVEI